MKHLKLYESISNYQVRMFNRKQFSDFVYKNREKYHVFGEENHLKSRIKYFDWDDIGYSTSAHWLKKHYDTMRFIVAYNDDDILGICKFAWFDFQKHYSMSYCNTNKNYYQLGVSKRLLESLFKYFSKTYPDDILHFSGYSIMGWKYLRTTILKLSEKYKVKIKEKSIEYDYSWDTDSEIVNKSQEVIKKLYPQHEAISVERATKLNYQKDLPNNWLFAEAVKNTKGAELTPEGLIINITRYQAEYQAGSPSLRTGVFYLPSGSPNEKHYRGGKSGYGGKEKYQGTTLIRRPIFVKGATGGKAPETAYDLIKGKGAFQKMRSEVLATVTGWNKRVLAEDIADILTKYNETDYDENYDLGYNILQYSKVGNTLAYAIQENIIAHAVRDAGYDSVVGYSSKKDGSPFISEIFDVREITYPMQDEESDIHSAYL